MVGSNFDTMSRETTSQPAASKALPTDLVPQKTSNLVMYVSAADNDYVGVTGTFLGTPSQGVCGRNREAALRSLRRLHPRAGAAASTGAGASGVSSGGRLWLALWSSRLSRHVLLRFVLAFRGPAPPFRFRRSVLRSVWCLWCLWCLWRLLRLRRPVVFGRLHPF